MVTITPNKDGRVMRIGYADKALPKGAIEVGSIPQEPTLEEGKACELYYDKGALVWRIFDAPPPPQEEYTEPAYEEPTPPTRAEIEALRAAAYRDRVDPLTCQIQRMEDMGAAASEIDALRAVRDATFYAIQREFPYV